MNGAAARLFAPDLGRHLHLPGWGCGPLKGVAGVASKLHAGAVPTPSTDLLRPDLWELLLPGLLAARAAGRTYTETAGYVPRQSLTVYQENDAGWPHTTADRLSTGTKGALDWSELFGLKEGRLTHLLVADIPDLASSLREIGRRAIADGELLQGLSMLAPRMDVDERREQVEFETLRFLVGEILNRADAIGAETEDEVRRIYVELEQSRFAAKLSGDVVVPLIAVTFDLHEPLQICSDSWIEPLTEADHRARALPWSGQGAVNPWVAAGATHAVVTRGVHFTNTVNHLLRMPRVPPEFATGIVESVAEAIDIVAEQTTGYAQVLVRPHGWADSWTEDLPPLWSAWTGRAYPEELNDRRWDKSFEPITAVDTDQIARISQSLISAPNNVRIAARRCRRVSFRDDAEDRLLDAAIGLEALLGKEPDALTHRLAQRAAAALADLLPPENTYSLAKQFYGVRSKVAHGATPKRTTCRLGEREWSAVGVGRFLLRELLKSRLLAEDPWDPESLDTKMLRAVEKPGGYPTVGEEE